MKNIKIVDGILLQTIEDNIVVVSPENGMITTINETGAFLLTYLKNEGEATREDFIKVLLSEYNVSDDVVESDVDNFINEMINNNIIN